MGPLSPILTLASLLGRPIPDAVCLKEQKISINRWTIGMLQMSRNAKYVGPRARARNVRRVSRAD